MTEEEKMSEGEIYNANYDEELIKERIEVKDKCNNIKPTYIEGRTKLLKEILEKYEETFYIEQPFICDYGYNIEIGKNFYVNHNLVILDGNVTVLPGVSIEDNVVIGAGGVVTKDILSNVIAVGNACRVIKEI